MSAQRDDAGSDDSRSEAGDLFQQPDVGATVPREAPPVRVGVGGPARPSGIPPEGVTRRAPPTARAIGRGVVQVDTRKFRYDVNRARTMPVLAFGASRADRLDAVDAGNLLERIHEMFSINRETENVILAFNKALFFEHTINGASLMQGGEGVLTVGESSFELASVKQLLGTQQRRFFRALADDITAVNREVLASYDAHDPVAAEKHGQIMQVAVERGLQKYPYLAHDSSDAGIRLSVEERKALMASKKVVLESVVNLADNITARVDGSRAGNTPRSVAGQ